MKKVFIFILLVLVVGLGAYIALDKLDYLTPTTSEVYVYDSEDEQMEKLGSLELSITDSILGEARETSELIVLEQDICATQVWDKSWGDWDVFSKTKTITIFGTGYYVVDLSNISANSITVDEEKLTVTVNIPDPTLKNVDVNLEKTEFQETDNGLFRFGEIKVTAEQSTIMLAKCEEAMEKQLSTDNMTQKAKESADKKIVGILQPVVNAVNKDYEVIVK